MSTSRPTTCKVCQSDASWVSRFTGKCFLCDTGFKPQTAAQLCAENRQIMRAEAQT